MQQVLFHIPFLKGWFDPEGIPVYGFGAMLFVTFVLVTWWGGRRSQKIAGLSAERFQDMAVVLFVAGIVGARILYMIQYSSKFPDKSLLGLAGKFFKIWEGGIIFYGSALGGAFGYGLFYWFVIRKLRINGWKLADAVAPMLALGLAVGRIGCYLNGCCWGQTTCEPASYVPLGAAHFPLLPAHERSQMVYARGLQTSTGFAVEARPRNTADPRTVVAAVEKGSAAEQAGLKPGDKIVAVNGRPNEIVADAAGRPTTDTFTELVYDWPRGQNTLALTVERGGETVDLPAFVPRTVGLFPTQLYEMVSMFLLVAFLLAYYPFRRHDGQLMTVCMAVYAVHRFINESIRIEPAIAGTPLTLSQWISVAILLAAAGLEAYLWVTSPSRWKAAESATPAQVAPAPRVDTLG